MDRLQELRAKNPHLRIYSVHDEQFRRYGNVIEEDTTAFRKAAETIPFPESGSAYEAAIPALDTLPEAERFRALHCGGLDEQVGLCWGHSDTLNALEWHTCNEFNIAVREMVLLLAKRDDLDADGRLDSAKVNAFYLAEGDFVEVYADTLHFCPCEVTKNGFSSIVALQRGTNLPLKPEQITGALWAANKWLIAHKEHSKLVEKGAVVGIYGENWKVNKID